MLVRCLRSSFAARSFFRYSSVVESSVPLTVAIDAPKLTNTEVSAQKTANSNKPASSTLGSLATRLLRLPKCDSEGAANPAAVIAKWIEEGRVVSKSQLMYAVRGLITRNDLAKALMIRDSMLELKDLKLNPLDYALHTGLIYRVHGLQSAEKFFDGIPEEMKTEMTWTALLQILVKKGDMVKAEALMEKMKKSGFLSNPEPYIHMMSLYFSKEQFDRAEEMNSSVKKLITSDVRVYNVWLSACASGKDVEGAERAFVHMKEAKVEPNWLTHGILAGVYIKKKLFEKAGAALKDMEGIAPPPAPASVQIYCSIIRMHGDIGNKEEVMRVWRKLKSKTTGSNNAYGSMVSTLLKLNLFEEADEIFEEWESFPKSGNARDSSLFRSMLLRKYGGEDGKMSPDSVPEHTEEDNVESDLGFQADKVE